MAVNTVLSTSLCEGIANWIVENSYFVDKFGINTFKHIDSYYRIDIPQAEMTSVAVYPITADTKSQPKYENGIIGIDLNFNLQKQRDPRGYLIYSTVSQFRAQLLANPLYIQQYISSIYVPGLQMIQSQNVTDMRKLMQQIQNGSYGNNTVTFELTYKIGILTNQRALWAQGFDFYSPTTQIYFPIETIDVEIYPFGVIPPTTWKLGVLGSALGINTYLNPNPAPAPSTGSWILDHSLLDIDTILF